MTVSYVVLISKSCKVLDFVGISGLVFLNACVKLRVYLSKLTQSISVWVTESPLQLPMKCDL